jgi:hypothetical protein
VRAAAWEVSGLSGDPSGIEREILSTASPHGAAMEWIPADPFKVYAIMEPLGGNAPLQGENLLADTSRGWRYMTRVVDRLRADPAIADAGWESYNAAIAYFWIRPR